MHGTRVCARRVKPKTKTVTIAPSPIGQNCMTFDNGNCSRSGMSYISPGTYTFEVFASATWPLSF